MPPCGVALLVVTWLACACWNGVAWSMETSSMKGFFCNNGTVVVLHREEEEKERLRMEEMLRPCSDMFPQRMKDYDTKKQQIQISCRNQFYDRNGIASDDEFMDKVCRNHLFQATFNAEMFDCASTAKTETPKLTDKEKEQMDAVLSCQKTRVKEYLERKKEEKQDSTLRMAAEYGRANKPQHISVVSEQETRHQNTTLSSNDADSMCLGTAAKSLLPVVVLLLFSCIT